MVKIAIAGASSGLARGLLDKLVATEKHEIKALVRKSPSDFPQLQGVEWIQTDFKDKKELVNLLQGVETVLCFFAVHLDPGSENQKRLIDAAIEADVKRFAPSEWGPGVKLADSLDALSWYTGKTEVTMYLEELNSKEKVLEYCRFQPGGFMDYFCHPHQTSKYLNTAVVNIDYEKKSAMVVEGTLDDEIVYTAFEDIINVVTLAVEHQGEWPAVGGICGDRLTIRQLLEIGEKVRGQPFTIEWLKMEDVAAGELKTDNYPRINLPSVPQDQVEAFSKMVIVVCEDRRTFEAFLSTDKLSMSYYQQPNQQPYYQSQQQPYHQPGPPASNMANYQQAFQTTPPGYSQQGYQQGPNIVPGPPIYHPRVGFTRLPARFHIWNVMTSGGSSILELGPQFKGPVAYSAKMFSSSRLKIKEGPYESGKQPVCSIESRHTFSQQSTISFNGFESKFRETSMFMEGASWPFEVDVNGQVQMWQWRKRQGSSSLTIKNFFGSGSQSKLGSWDLIPASGQGPSVASFEAAGGSTSEQDAMLGEFMLRGPASVGQMGDIFVNVSIAVFLRIISQHYISRIAASVG
ncbi:hypothetical protein FLONG3_6050 [Fusarium longipes]|uniref:NmrA-like domain-containing protein n=1 Tax=Fusarium longipes TaxID=694270 RepID=A0A395SPV0_9HYPO|nr:hypothetical protein FLONG3_6050 [Fusarium longipes]